jgi:DNA-binding GntR family transcriptional regulator
MKRARKAPGGAPEPPRLDDWSPELLKSRVYEKMLIDIIFGRLQPGERLDEDALARRYDSGLSGVREALARLALEGLVQRRARIGTSVAPLDLIEAKEAFEARKLVETHCAGLAARHSNAADIKAIRSSFDGAEAAIARNDNDAIVAMDRTFHVAVANASQNRILAKIVLMLHHKAARFWLYAMAAPPRSGEEALARHRAVADAIESGDVRHAEAAMLRVLEDFPQDVGTSIAAMPAPGHR